MEDRIIRSLGYGRPTGGIKYQLVLQEHGIDLNDHASRTVTGIMLSEFNLVLVMEDNHKEVVKLAFPEYTDRIYMLSEMVGEIFDIVDPIGRSLADFEETALEMERILTEGFEKISILAADKPIIYAS